MKNTENSNASEGSLGCRAMRLAFVPVWALTLLILPFLPDAHPWKHRKMTLGSWVTNGTQDALAMSVFFWVAALCIVAVTLRLLTA